MEAPSPRYIITRAVFFIALLVAGLFTYSFIKKQRRQAALTAELQVITSDSSFFQQFYAEEARKTLVRAIGLMAEANFLGMPPEESINSALGVKQEFFSSDSGREEPPAREKIIRNCLRGNYDNFLKFGYTADFRTLEAMREGNLPPIPSGPHSGRKPEVASLVDASLLPGIEKVVANLEIRPPADEKRKPGEIEIASAKDAACERTLEALSAKP
jgi:hypothetical protein